MSYKKVSYKKTKIDIDTSKGADTSVGIAIKRNTKTFASIITISFVSLFSSIFSFFVFSIFSILLSNAALASNAGFKHDNSAKEISFENNEQIKVILSNRDINKVLVKGDKIQGVNGPAGLYVARNDASGSAYINAYGETTFTIFMSTVKGHSFSLLVTPKTTAGKTIILEPATPILLTKRFEETENYQKVLIGLIKGMINNEVFEDYAYNKISRISKVKRSGKTKTIDKRFENIIKKADFYGVADISPIATYSGSYLLGIVSEIKNKTKKPITLKPSYFYKTGVRAVALSQQTIAPSAIGLLYQVISRDN